MEGIALGAVSVQDYVRHTVVWGDDDEIAAARSITRASSRPQAR
jgi:hypothetical protein